MSKKTLLGTKYTVFMNSIKRSPTYREKLLHEALAMGKQLGIPRFFLTDF